jgi:hypothetical protein
MFPLSEDFLTSIVTTVLDEIPRGPGLYLLVVIVLPIVANALRVSALVALYLTSQLFVPVIDPAVYVKYKFGGGDVLGVAVKLGVIVGVILGVAVLVGVILGVKLGVAVILGVKLGVAVIVGVILGVILGVAVWVGEGAIYPVEVLVVTVGVILGVAVIVGVGLGSIDICIVTPKLLFNTKQK